MNIRNPHVEGRWNWSRWDLDPAKMEGKCNIRRGKTDPLHGDFWHSFYMMSENQTTVQGLLRHIYITIYWYYMFLSTKDSVWPEGGPCRAALREEERPRLLALSQGTRNADSISRWGLLQKNWKPKYVKTCYVFSIGQNWAITRSGTRSRHAVLCPGWPACGAKK